MSRRERSKKKKKKLINYFIIIIILGILICAQIEEYNEETIEKNEYITQSLSTENKIVVNQIDNKLEQNITKNRVQETYKNYAVVAQLEIPKIELETLVLQEFSEDALNVSVTKFWGPNPNEIGNLCIAGHNFKKKNMFSNLKKIQLGDKIFVEDNKNGKVEYEVYEIYKVVPQDTSCLSQNTEGNKEVTLITCTSDSKKRIIIKAREVK